jgi:hypothetical protein
MCPCQNVNRADIDTRTDTHSVLLEALKEARGTLFTQHALEEQAWGIADPALSAAIDKIDAAIAKAGVE